jgi:hypothetical protein
MQLGMELFAEFLSYVGRKPKKTGPQARFNDFGAAFRVNQKCG